MKDIIYKLIEKRISTLKQEKYEKQKQIEETFQKKDEHIIKFKSVDRDLSDFAIISYEDLKNVKEYLTEEYYNKLVVYMSLYRNSTFNFDEELYSDLRKICVSIVNNFYNEQEKLKENNFEIEKINYEIEDLIRLKNKVNSDFSDLVSSDIDSFYSLFKQMNVPTKEIIEYIIFINNSYLKNVEFVQEEKEEEIVETNLNIEDLEKLFDSFGYDLTYIKDAYKEELLKYGNLENIKSIFEVFEEYEIDLNRNIINTTPIIKAKSGQLVKVLIYSKPELVKNLFEFAIDKGIVKGTNVDIVKLLETPSIFITRKQKYKIMVNDKNGGQGEFVSSGRNEDFFKNYELLESKYNAVVGDGRFIEKIFNKCDSIFDNAHEQVLNVIKVFELYGVSPENYLNSLSGFNSIRQADTFDLAIELNCFDYIKDNMSKAMLKTDDEMFLKIAIGLKEKIGVLFGIMKRDTIVGPKDCIYLKSASLTNLIRDYNLTFDKFDLNKSYAEDANRIFKEIEKVLSLNNNTDISMSLNDLSVDNTILSKLEKFVSPDNPMLYVINGIQISRLKVLRLYNTLKLNGYNDSIYSIIYILTRNSYITQEQFDKLKVTIRDLLKDKEKRI